MHSGGLVGCVDVSRPDLGLQQIQLDSTEIVGNLLRIWRQDQPEPRWPCTLAEAYIRGGDLIATYEPTNDWPYSSQLYWRLDAFEVPEVRSTASLLVSVQTHLLDTWPIISVGSELVCSEVLRLVPANNSAVRCTPSNREQWLQPMGDYCCILFRLQDHPWTYVEMIPANDLSRFRVWHNDDSVGSSEWQLFGEFLEKGVIRRARVEILLLPRDNDVHLATTCCRELTRRPPPLTT